MLKKAFFGTIVSKYGMIAINLILVFIMVFSLLHSMKFLTNVADDSGALDELIDAIAAILVAYGVVLEERDTIISMIKKAERKAGGDAEEKNTEYDDGEEELTHYCHYCGTTLVVIGLFIEVISEIVKIPHAVYNLASLERWLFGIALIFTAFSVWTVVHFSHQIVTVGKNSGHERCL